MLRLVPPLLIAALPACSPSKETRCKRYTDQSLALVMGLANGVADGLAGKDVPEVKLSDADKAAARQKVLDECMTWPEDFVACMTDGDFDSPKCQEAYAKKEGIVVPVKGREGPAPATRAILQNDYLVCGADRCYLAVDDEKLETLDGKHTVVGAFAGVTDIGGAPMMVSAKDGQITLLGDRNAIVFAGPRPAPDESFAAPIGVGEKGLALFDDGRVRRMVPPGASASDADDKHFVDTPWKVGGDHSALEHGELHLLSDGALAFYAGDQQLEVYARSGDKRFALHLGADLGEPLYVGDRVYLGAGKALLVLDLAKCKRDPELDALATAELTAPCLVARIDLDDIAPARPQALGGNVYALSAGRIHQVLGGEHPTKGWVAEVDGDALLAIDATAHDDKKRMLLATSRWTADHQARLVALDLETGTTLMQVDLASQMSLYDVTLARDGEHIVAQTSNRLFTWDLAALESALAE